MSTQHRPPDERRSLRADAESLKENGDGFELKVRLRNPLDRAVHYIADVRAMLFDPMTRTLRVQLSDQDREPPPGGIAMEPKVRTIDPQGEATATIRLPKTIVKLAAQPSPEGDVLFEEHAIGDATAIEIVIGWADTPYYGDPRESARGEQPIARWEDGIATTVYRPGD